VYQALFPPPESEPGFEATGIPLASQSKNIYLWAS
jgi:hypothetical protein